MYVARVSLRLCVDCVTLSQAASKKAEDAEAKQLQADKEAEQARAQQAEHAQHAAKTEAISAVDVLASAHSALHNAVQDAAAAASDASASAAKAIEASTVAAVAVGQQAGSSLPMPSEMDACLAATQAAQADAKLFAKTAETKSQEADTRYAAAGRAIEAARDCALSGDLEACLDRRQTAEADLNELRVLLGTAEQWRDAASAEAEKAVKACERLNNIIMKPAVEAGGPSSDATTAGFGAGVCVGADQVPLKTSTAVTWLPPAVGQRRHVLVQGVRPGSKPLADIFLQTAGFTTRTPALVSDPAGPNTALRPGVWVKVLDEDYVVSMSGYSEYSKRKPVLAVCLTKPPTFEEHFQSRLQHVRVRGDEVTACSLSCVFFSPMC